MRMAASAAKCHSQEYFASRVNLFVNRVHPQFFFVRFCENLSTEGEEPSSTFGFTIGMRE